MEPTNKLEGAIVIILDKWARIIRSRVEQKHGNLSRIEGESHSEHTAAIIGGMIVAKLDFWGQKAYIGEYGSGSLMEKTLEDNPYLREYFSSELWNPLRTGYSIRGRAEGDYIDLDGKTQHSTGAMKGLNLEDNEDFRPIEPMHIIEHEINDAIPEIIEDLQSAVSDAIVKEINEIFGNQKIYI
jgi:hypothetical protein